MSSHQTQPIQVVDSTGTMPVDPDATVVFAPPAAPPAATAAPQRSGAWRALYVVAGALLLVTGALLGGWFVSQMSYSSADLQESVAEAELTGYDAGYAEGYQEAADEASEGADAAFDAGYRDGFRDGFDEGSVQPPAVPEADEDDNAAADDEADDD